MTLGPQPDASQPWSTPHRPTRKRATVAGLLGVLGTVMLAGGTGFAYAASTEQVETGYLTVVDEGTPPVSSAVDGECSADLGEETNAPGFGSDGGAW